MANATSENRCTICNKPNAILKCGGCLGDFCYNHVREHRQELNKQLDEIEINRDVLRQILNEQIKEPQKHVLIQQIDQWEQESIDKIKQTAEETRKVLLEYMNRHTDRIESNLNNLTDRLKQSRDDNDFVETNLNEWNRQLSRLNEELDKPSTIDIVYNSAPLVTKICVDALVHLSIPKISVTAKWVQNGITVAGGYGNGNGLNQMNQPYSTYVDDDQTIYVADQLNHRIVEWKKGATDSRIVAGENGAGNRTDQLNQPVYVIIDRETDCLLISDTGNRRVVRWPRRNSIGGEAILSNAKCWGLALDNDGYIYVTDASEHAVIRYGSGGTDGTVVAGGNGKGDRLNQLNGPFHIFVDQEHSVYVSDRGNHRVMKWVKDAKEGIVVAGGQGQGNSLTQLSEPFGVVVDYSGTVYIADRNNYRVMRWLKGATQGSVVVGGNGHGGQANQFKYPCDLSFDRQNNLYVVDCNNHRVQKFNIETNSTM